MVAPRASPLRFCFRFLPCCLLLLPLTPAVFRVCWFLSNYRYLDDLMSFARFSCLTCTLRVRARDYSACKKKKKRSRDYKQSRSSCNLPGRTARGLMPCSRASSLYVSGRRRAEPGWQCPGKDIRGSLQEHAMYHSISSLVCFNPSKDGSRRTKPSSTIYKWR